MSSERFTVAGYMKITKKTFFIKKHEKGFYLTDKTPIKSAVGPDCLLGSSCVATDMVCLIVSPEIKGNYSF